MGKVPGGRDSIMRTTSLGSRLGANLLLGNIIHTIDFSAGQICGV